MRCFYPVPCPSFTNPSLWFDATIAPGPLKKRSVVANTVLGTIVGGDIGGIIGAASAIDTNNRRASAVANYRPLIIDMKLKKIVLTVYSYMMQDWVYIHVDNSYFEKAC